MSDSPVSDESLLQATGKGDLKAFEEIVRRHQTWAWRIAYRFLGDEEAAADLTQEAFLRLLDASSRYRPTAKLTTYFYQIITRLCLDRAKKKQPLYMNEAPETPDPHLEPAEAMIRKEAAVAVRAALDALPPSQRMTIVLRYYEELNYEEIASALETTPKAVERLLARGRDRLRSILGSRNNFSFF